MTERPYIVRFENEGETAIAPKLVFDVVVNHADCAVATKWAREYFSLYCVEYLNSDFDGNHTYRETTV